MTTSTYSYSARTYNRTIPACAHMKLTTHGALLHPVPVLSHSRAMMRQRPLRAHSPIDIAHTPSYERFNDETREMKAHANIILSQIQHQRRNLPRRPTGISYTSAKCDDNLIKLASSHLENKYQPRKPYIGRGNLACMSYYGGKPISRRRQLCHDENDTDYHVTVTPLKDGKGSEEMSS